MARDVKCSVQNCQYWGQGRECTASAIEVNVDGGSDKASYVAETNCHTFKAK